MTRTDAELLAAASEDPQAFREFYDRYAAWMRSWFLRQTGSETAALDLTAETFAQAWHASRRFRDMADGSGAPWLFGIARNLLRQYHKHNRIETAARERLGLADRLRRVRGLRAGRRAQRGRVLAGPAAPPCRARAAGRAAPGAASCGSCSSWPTRRSPGASDAARTPRGCASRARCGR